ncbi:hypothetical protein A2Y85_00310 [candidate division WOR-3 bacterium RBG_13_43_14]|uniref:Response regulatory domain-containing protein n=1 Tax=candidate division WOR-3 bacterium RBG_13_43_14 TaxID=1802590 RepID=A0A1F4U2L9_UNCW3|nr:MAG: hypothetical protein A2Y85_00310 [candidate division WOR-3 bacterium RBG_13_43_14]
MKAKILLISQDGKLLQQVTNALTEEGYTTISPERPSDARTLYQKENYNLVLIDVNIHETPYDRFVKDIRKNYPDTAIVLITGHSFPYNVIKGEVMDVDGYIVQPLTQEKIVTSVNRAVRQNELARENKRLLLIVTAAKKEWEATVDAIDDPLFVTDFDYTILRANLATFQGLGRGVKEVIGLKCHELMHCSNHALDDCPGKKARDSGEPATETVSFKGLRRRMTCSVYPQVFPVGGGLVHYLREPAANTEQQAETMAKYERLFDDARLPVLLIDGEDYKVADANQSAIMLFKYDPEQIFDVDVEELFAPSLRETVIDNMMKQLDNKEKPLKVKIMTSVKEEIDAFIIANRIEISQSSLIQLFIIPVDLISGER